VSESPRRFTLIVCRGPTCGDGRNSAALTARLRETVAARALEEQVTVLEETCFGHCLRGPNVLVYDNDKTDGSRIYGPGASAPAAILYNRVTVHDLERVVDRHLAGGMVVRPVLNRSSSKDP
jgi:(2Fe-2S) ferredoxin